MRPLRKTARLAGWLYLVVVLTGPFVLLYVPGKLFVPGDATATARNILAHEGLFRTHIVLGLVGELFFIGAVLALYRLLREVHRELAAIMALLILIDVPLALLSVANELATLTFLRDPGFLTVFDEPQRHAIATLLLQFDRQGILVSELFWGLWLLPLGALVFRSGFLPRLLGVWLFLNGLAFVAISVVGLTWPPRHETLSTVLTPVLFGEVALMLWLIVVGARVPRAPAEAR